jgi:hypothetical protein
MRAGIRVALAFVAMLAASAVIAAPAGAGGQDDGAGKRAACDISGQQTDLGASYVTSLKVKNTSCKKGAKVIKAYHACRKDNGGADGRCNSRVEGFKCEEGSRESTPAQYNAKVKCKKGAKKVKSTYTQNT